MMKGKGEKPDIYTLNSPEANKAAQARFLLNHAGSGAAWTGCFSKGWATPYSRHLEVE